MKVVTKCCPLLIRTEQEDYSYQQTFPSVRSMMLKCIMEKCAAYDNGVCKKFETKVEVMVDDDALY